MVDAVVSFVVERLGDFLIEKAAFLHGVRDQVKWVKDELRHMHRFLQDAEEKQYGDATLGEWVSDIRELAYDIEDLLDKFHLQVQTVAADDGATMEEKPKSGCLPSMCSCIVAKGKENVNLYNIGKEIEEFKDRIDDLSRRRQLYGLQDSTNNGQMRNKALGKLKDIRRVTSFAVEKNVVGFEDALDELLTKLLDDEPRRFIISIYGMGGLGKTTLAGKLYHNNDVRKRFNCHAWVSVSQDYTTRDLLLRIIDSFGFKAIERKELEKMNEEALERYLYKSLQELSYVVVIDDVWDRQAWASLKRAFPDNQNGSRVIATTRNKDVAECLDERTYAHQLRYLKPDESWQLFCEKTFHSIKIDEGLEKLAREMVQKCDGLPLAIIVLGGLLSRRKPQEWRVVHDQIWRHLKDDRIEISHLLTLSFNYLPYQLKQCFLYLGIFPEDSKINPNKLIRLLVAEGFIQQDENRIMEEVAKDYLDELVNRSLLQVEIDRFEDHFYRVHDLLRDLAIDKVKDLNFFCICDEDKHSDISPKILSCSRQAIYSKIKTSSWLEQCNPRLRSLFLFDERQPLTPVMCRKFNSLRVLNVVRLGEEGIAKAIEKLIHLKYLQIRSFNVLSSSSVFYLQRLQTLEMPTDFGPIMIPAEIGKLQELRHLIGRYFEGPSIDSLQKLQTLRFVSHGSWVKIKPENLVDLRDLGFFEDRSWMSIEFSFDSVVKLKSLRTLEVWLSRESFRSFQPLSHCKLLVELRMTGKIEKVPEDIHQLLPNLEYLSLSEAHLEDDPMSLFDKLPNLMFFTLRRQTYSGKKMICGANGFFRLEALRMLDQQIEELQVEEGALPSLKRLRIPNECKLITPETMRSRIQKMLILL